MRKLFRAALVGLALLAGAPALAGCAYLAQVSGNAQVATADEKALIAAELAFSAATDALRAADTAGLITAERAAQIIPVYRSAYAALLRARQLYDANQTAEAGIATGDAVAAVTTLAGLLADLGIIQR